MIKLFVIAYLVFLCQINANGQEVKIETYDINKDGFSDSVTFFYDGGSGYGGNYCSIVNGKNGQIFELNSASSFANVKNRIEIPKELLKKKNSAFLAVFREKLLPPKQTEADPTLQWILAAESSIKRETESIYFNTVTRVNPRWTIGQIQSPTSYYVDRGDHWLIYYGHNHYQNNRVPLHVVDSSEKYKVYATSMGVAVQKGDEFAWVYVSDYELFGGPEKLRWAALPTIILKDDYLFIWQTTTPDLEGQIMVVNILTGDVGRLNWQGSIEINENILSITNNIKTIQWPIDFLIEELIG